MTAKMELSCRCHCGHQRGSPRGHLLSPASGQQQNWLLVLTRPHHMVPSQCNHRCLQHREVAARYLQGGFTELCCEVFPVWEPGRLVEPWGVCVVHHGQ